LNYAYDKAQNKTQVKAQSGALSDREYILLLLRENPSVTQNELSEIMGKSRRSIQMIMKELIEEGVVERVGSKKVGSWMVK
jgi:ATP-dependent DNA helicase RecG